MNQHIREQVINHLAETKKSQAKFSKEVGVSSAIISQYLNDGYPGDVAKLESNILKYFEMQEESNSIGSLSQSIPEYAATSISEQVYKTIKLCHITRRMRVFMGDAGIGKTKGAVKYCDDNSQAILITASRACKGLKDIYSLIADELRIDSNMRVSSLERELKEKLFGSNKIIIIDEAQHLPVSTLDGIRTLNDWDRNINAEPIPLVFIGNPELYVRISGTKALDQVRNRAGHPTIVRNSEIVEDDIKKLFPIYAEPDYEKELKYIYGISQTYWGIRGAANVYQEALLLGDITLKSIKRIAGTSGVLVKG